MIKWDFDVSLLVSLLDEGYLLFLVHVNDIGALHIGCRLKGESVVTNVYLNGGSEKQVSLVSINCQHLVDISLLLKGFIDCWK